MVPMRGDEGTYVNTILYQKESEILIIPGAPFLTHVFTFTFTTSDTFYFSSKVKYDTLLSSRS